MEPRKNNGILIIVVLLFVTTLCLGGYIVCDNLLNNDKKIDSNVGDEDKNNQGNDQNDSDNGLNSSLALTLYNRIVSDPVIEVVLMSLKNTISTEQMNNDELGAIIMANASASSFIQNVCNTSLEQELINNNIIGKQNEGQYDCNSILLLSKNNIDSISRNLFGKTFDFNNQKTNSFMLFNSSKEGSLGVFKYAGDSYKNEFKMGKYSIKNGNVEIEVIPNGGTYNRYILKFIISGNNYYLQSIERM